MLTGISGSNSAAVIPYGNYHSFSLNSFLKLGLVTSLFTTTHAKTFSSFNSSACNITEYPIENFLNERFTSLDPYSQNEILPKISSEFSGVEPGDFVFFAHVNNLRQLAISTFQKSNITHVGIVTDINATKISVAEIPGYGKSSTISTYNLDNLHDDEELIFTSPNTLKTAKNSLTKFSNHFLSLTQKPDTFNQYDLPSLLAIPSQSEKLDSKAEKNLIDSFIEYYIFQREPHHIRNKIMEPKKYFCSSFVSELYQLNQMATKVPLNLLNSLKSLRNESFDHPIARLKLVDGIHAKWKTLNFWNLFKDDQVFQLSSKASTPEKLYELTKKIGGKSIVVKNINANKRFYSKNYTDEQALDFLEYQVTKLLDRVSKGETITPDDHQIQEIIILLEKTFAYSKESLNCFVKECFNSSEKAACIESCLEKTLTLKEKLHIFFISRQINRVMDQLLHTPDFLEFVHEPHIDKINKLKNLKVEQILENRWDIALPTNTLSFTSVENTFAKKALQQLDTKSLVKYLPLSIAYSPPKEVLKKFMEEENISLIELTKMALLMKQLNQGHREIDQLAQILQLTERFGINKQSIEAFKPTLKITAQKTGYSLETLDCIANDLISGKIDAAKAKECIETTLTLKEKLWVYLSSQSISYGVDNLLDNEDFLQFIKDGKIDKFKTSTKNVQEAKEKFLDILFPKINENFSDAATSMIGRKVLRMSMDSGMVQFLLKDVFLGLNYIPQTEKLTEFLKNENLDLYTLLLKTEDFAKQL